MYWSELGPDENCEYYTCSKCQKCPAIALCDDDTSLEEGPYCNSCWIHFINSLFDELKQKLEDEDWGSSPELRGETEWEVWREGFRLGENRHGQADLVGKVMAVTFPEACDKLLGEYKSTYDGQKLTWWGSRLFNNETDARERFG